MVSWLFVNGALLFVVVVHVRFVSWIGTFVYAIRLGAICRRIEMSGDRFIMVKWWRKVFSRFAHNFSIKPNTLLCCNRVKMPPRMSTVLTALVYLYLGLSNTCSGQHLRSHTLEAPTTRRLACERKTTLLTSGQYVYTGQNPLTTKVRPWHVSRVSSHFDFW
jgi:hypothetical protein